MSLDQILKPVDVFPDCLVARVFPIWEHHSHHASDQIEQRSGAPRQPIRAGRVRQRLPRIHPDVAAASYDVFPATVIDCSRVCGCKDRR